MNSRTEIAHQFIQKQLSSRSDIVGVLLVGSVSRGEDTASSDIDLRFMVEGKDNETLDRENADGWEQGVYIDATFASRDIYMDLEKILENPVRANDMHSGVIVYDPTGLLAQLQIETRREFMKPERIATRVQPLVGYLGRDIANLQDAMTSDDALRMCVWAGRVLFRFAVIPLMRRGVAPSSTRHIIQLGAVDPELKASLFEIEGTTHMNEADALQRFQIAARLNSACDVSSWGQLTEYMIRKANWLAQNGYPREALHGMWNNNGFRANDCLKCNDPQVIDNAGAIARKWLRAMGWEGQDALAAKMEMIEIISQSSE
jgi:hypothetical protein